MLRLGRRVRFSINPFLEGSSDGFNSFASKPPGEGLSIFLELEVEVEGEAEPSTGFVVNVSEIDKNVREFAIPVFAGRITESFGWGEHIDIVGVGRILRSAWGALPEKFGSGCVNRLSLKLNPFRELAMDSRDSEATYFSEKFEFAATHKLWNDEFSAERNLEIFGKCANPSGHGHNYIVEVTVRRGGDEEGFSIADFERTVDGEFVELVDHKNLNEDIDEFGKSNPTVENIAVFAWKRLVGKFEGAELHCVTVWESDRTYCSYYG